MKSLIYSFDDVSFRFISTLTGVSDFNGKGLGTITLKSLADPTQLLRSADGQTMTMKMPGSQVELLVSTPQVSHLSKALWNNYELLSKVSSSAWNTNQVWLRHTASGTEITLTMVSYKNPPDLVFGSRGTFTEFSFLAESMNIVCL